MQSPFRWFGDISERRFNRVVLALVGIGFALLIAAGAATGWMVARGQDFDYWVSHTYQVENRINLLRLDLERMETGRRGYLLRQEQRFADVFADRAAAIGGDMDAVAALIADNPRQRARIAEVRGLIDHILARSRASMDLARTGRQAAAIESFRADGSVDAVRATRRLLEAMVAEETGLLAARDADRRHGANQLVAAIAVAGVLLLFVGLLSLAVIRRYTRQLSASREALRTLNLSLEDMVAERTMELRRANDEIQRFAYIVSHDLRSPLVNVLGFTAELDAALKPLGALIARADEVAPGLVDDTAREAVTADVPEAIGFIRSSTQKMDRLINAILRLSREGRRVIAPEPLDMTALVRSVADSLRHRSDELGATIDVPVPLPPIVSDRVAIEQIFSNLIENAVKYLKPGRPGRIEIRADRAPGRILFHVADNGRGIDPRDHDRVFDLFRRSGPQDQPGEGIGLAHVRALAYRLGGTVECRSTLGEGTIFTVSLPETFVGEQRIEA